MKCFVSFVLQTNKLHRQQFAIVPVVHEEVPDQIQKPTTMASFVKVKEKLAQLA